MNVIKENRAEKIKELSLNIVRWHYNDGAPEKIVECFDKELAWIGPGESEYIFGSEKIAKMFMFYKGLIPRCEMWDEEVFVMENGDVFVANGNMWLSLKTENNDYFKTRQRFTFVWRWYEDGPKIFNMHISNPYEVMQKEEMLFPTFMGNYSHEYVEKIFERKIQDITRMYRKYTEQLIEEASHDGLTSLYNRNYAVKNIEKELVKRERNCFLIMDLDNFKGINDNYGHIMGDKVLISLASYLKEVFRREDICGRLGGDEFMVFISNAPDVELIYKRIEKIQKVFDTYLKELKIKVKSGITVGGLCGRGFESFDEIYSRADEVLYKVKNRGRGGVRIEEV